MEIYRYIVATCIRVACILLAQIRRARRDIKAMLHIWAYTLQHPYIRYRVALLLAAILAFLLGLPLFILTLSHTSFAFIEHM